MPKPLVAVMSAKKLETKADPDDPDSTIHCFEQKVPISSYLMALAVGALQSRYIYICMEIFE